MGCARLVPCRSLGHAPCSVRIRGDPPMAKYGKKAGKKVERAMHEMKRGKLKSGRSGKRVKSRKQAIAIGLSEARREGGKVPRKRGGRKRAAGGRKRSAGKKR